MYWDFAQIISKTSGHQKRGDEGDIIAASGQVEAGQKIEGVGVEQVKKKPTEEDRRLKDIPAATIFARMYTATAGALKVVVDRANTSNKPDMVQQQARASGDEVDAQQVQKSVVDHPTAGAQTTGRDGAEVLVNVGALDEAADRSNTIKK
ncbi:hypothetical protein A4A49_39605 [Nicotiana attenuata]|uniref:Uncharacterized protein n=1 Tax=Nicotiana attenuata TaxID=49451 RepID=A0A1J6KBY3_NICAT|nr:hypothetical protein A4A49_39605 [Nicotiana attenuata]